MKRENIQPSEPSTKIYQKRPPPKRSIIKTVQVNKKTNQERRHSESIKQ